ncbi:MAG: glycosyltransferase [Lautropia sp.]|nr:glycosyltransferase [Lautropia sp.]
MKTVWLLAFLISCAWMFYTYLGYPLLLKWQRRRQLRQPSGSEADTRRPIADEELPDIAVVIVARHAADLIGRKIRSCLDSEYPGERIRVVLAVDGPDEATARAAESLNDPRVTVLRNSEHRGKSATLNDAIATCHQPILILSDARQRLDPKAIRLLVEALLRDPGRGAISGELQLEVDDADFVGQGLDAYWRYEKWLRRTESEVASTIGATGALYAIRRSAFRPIPSQTILDDVLIPMQMVLDGHRVGFEAGAIAYDLPSISMEQEKRRKIRTLAGNFQLLQLCPVLISPSRNPAFVGFFSHKFCRLLTPVALLLMLLSTIALAGGSWLFGVLLLVEMGVIIGAILARAAPSSRRLLPVRLSSTFVEMHLFIVLGFVEFLRNRNLHRWSNESTASTAVDRPLRVLYLVSLFPCWSETFIVREIGALQKRGVDIRILSLKAACEPMVQPDAQAMLPQVIYTPQSVAGLKSVLPLILLHPLQSARELWPLLRSLWRRPVELLKSVATWWRTLSIVARVKAFDPDHIHAHWATYPSSAARILAARIHRPWSFTGHAHDIFVHDQDLSAKLRQADFTVTISEYNRKQLAERLPMYLQDRLTVIHCGVPTDALDFVTTGRDPTLIVAVGRLDPIKGFIHLIEACALLKRQGVAFRCELIGDGPLREELQRAITRAELDAQVVLRGALPQDEVRNRISQAALFVLPAVQLSDGNADGIPVALMEAMASGASVVSTRVSGIPELIHDNENGLLVAPGNAHELALAARRLLDDSSLRATLAQAARRHVEQHFDAHTEADRLLHRLLMHHPRHRDFYRRNAPGIGADIGACTDTDLGADVGADGMPSGTGVDADRGTNTDARTGTDSSITDDTHRAPSLADLSADIEAEARRANRHADRLTTAASKQTTALTEAESNGRTLPAGTRVLLMSDEMEVGGSQRQIVQLAVGLKQKGISPLVLYFRNPSFLIDVLHAAGVPTLMVEKKRRIDPGFVKRLRSSIRDWKADLVHCFSFTAELWGALAIRSLPRVQRPVLISSVRGTYEWYDTNQWRIKRWVSSQSAGIISNSQMGARYAADQMKWPETAFTIIPNGVERPEPDLNAAAALRRQYLYTAPMPHDDDMADTETKRMPAADAGFDDGLDQTPKQPNGVLLLFVGRLVEHKNLPRLLLAFAALLQSRPDVRLLLAGNGPLEQALQQQIQTLELDGKAILLGERDDVPTLMTAADIVVLPSLREGLSNVILEAMALGRPVISTLAGGTPEVIEDGITGLLVEPTDTDGLCAAMRTLVDDPHLRESLGRAGQRHVSEHYSPQAMVHAMCKEYQRVSQR